MNRAFEYVVQLLRMAVYPTAERPQPKSTLTADEWRAAYRMAVKHAVVGVAWDGVERLQTQAPEALQSLPADLMGKWFADAQTIEVANACLARQADKVQDFLRNGGFSTQLLKGRELAAYYPRPEHRQAADIDMWVRPSQGSLKVLRESLLSYLKSHEIEITAVVYHHIETMMEGTDVELHVTPTWLCNPIHNSRLQRLFAESRQLTPELQELYTLLHAFRHIYHDGLALRHVMDYQLVCEANRAKGVAKPVELYKHIGLSAFAMMMDEVADYLFVEKRIQTGQLSPQARHLLAALPARSVSRQVQWDYPCETLFNLPWRAMHHIWRRWNNY